WASTLSTMPSLLPSEEKTGKPISGLLIGAATDPGTAGLVDGLGSGSGAGTGWVAAGGDGDCGWAATGNSAVLATAVAAPSRKTRPRMSMSQILLTVTPDNNVGWSLFQDVDFRGWHHGNWMRDACKLGAMRFTNS